MTGYLGALANGTISLAYFAICYAIVAPLVRAGQARSNRLGTATAAIFFSCAVGHGFHAREALGHAGMGGMGWYEALWDGLTATVGLYYWTLRRTYGALMQGASLFEDLHQQQRMAALEHREALAAARAEADRDREAQARMLSAVMANSQSLVSVKDLAGRYLMANAAFLLAFGVQEDELLGRTDDFLDPQLAPAWRSNDLRAQREQHAVEEWSDSPAGRREYESVKFPLYDPDGDVYATCGISLDVTDRRRALAEITQARDAAVAATHAKSAFLATMSHEIRTPMNAVIGMTGLMLHTDLDLQQRELAETVRSSGDSLLTIINDILDFSKIEAGDLELEDQPFEVADCVESALALVALGAQDKELELVADLDPSCPAMVVGDVTRFRQVIVNLLSNAVKFTAAGDVVVKVTAQPLNDVAEGPVRVTVTVADTGIGVPPERMNRLFRSFSQVDSSTTRTYGGTGLGLVISRRIAEAMGGGLDAVSEVGIGSTFTFTAVLTGSTERRRPAGPAPGSLIGTNALVVDDNAANRRVLQLQLARWGMVCTDVATPAAALELLRGGARFDVAVLDMHMPLMDGAQLAAEFRALPAGRDMPLVLLTSLQWSLEPAQRALFVATLTKPARSNVLRAKLQAAVAPAEVELHRIETAGGGRPLDGEPVPGGALRVLLAEDNVVNQKVAQLMLARLGHHVDTVANGLEAVLSVNRADYDVVLMDMQMPQLDGLRATERIRAEVPPERQPVIVAMTANVQSEDKVACAEAGMDGYLAKPVRAPELAATLARVRPRAAAASDAGPAECVTLLRSRLRELGDLGRQSDRDLFVMLLQAFLDDSAGLLGEIAAAVAQGDSDLCRQRAHSLKGSAGNLGAARLAGLCAELESSHAADGPGGAAELLAAVRHELETVQQAVREVRDELGAAAGAL